MIYNLLLLVLAVIASVVVAKWLTRNQKKDVVYQDQEDDRDWDYEEYEPPAHPCGCDYCSSGGKCVPRK